MVLVLVAAAAACGEPAAEGNGRGTVPEPREEASTAVTPARYRTEVAFAPHGAGPAVYVRMEQVARPDALERQYRGWLLEGPGPREVLSVTDSLPVPRAAWRPLPAEGFRLVAARDGRLRALVLEPPGVSLRLEVDSTVLGWTGPTGQPERLAAARAVRDGDTVAGLLLERRLAHPLDGSGPRGETGLLLAAGPGPVGAAVLLTVPPGDTLLEAAGAHGVTEAGPRSWSPVRIGPEPEDGGSREVRLGEGGTVLRVRVSGGEGVLPGSVEGVLTVAGRERPVTGVLVGDAGG